MNNMICKNKENNLMDEFNDFINDFVRKDMKTDVVDNGESYTLSCDIAGFSKDEVNITFQDKTLAIKLEHKAKENKEKKNYIIRERSNASLVRKFMFEDVDSDSIKAKVNDGVLEITLAKVKKEDKNKYITIM